MTAPLTGVVPIVPTVFSDDETVDLDGTARVVDYLIDAGVDGVCLLANYSEQFSLTDAERDTLARTLIERVAGRLPVIVATSHYSARVTAMRSLASTPNASGRPAMRCSGTGQPWRRPENSRRSAGRR
jgi:4-hydroxy-tetrahydrodipicolinate synthase